MKHCVRLCLLLQRHRSIWLSNTIRVLVMRKKAEVGMDIGGKQPPCLLHSPAHEAKRGKNVLLEGSPGERYRERYEGKKRGWA